MHRYANPVRFVNFTKPLLYPLCGIGIILLAVGIYSGLWVTPPDYLQGETVRIMYIHVPCAWLGMLGWIGIALASFGQLIWRHPLSGVAARAVAVPGAIFTALCLITGSLWGRPTWGVYWVWDGRLTSMLILLFLYFGYIALANASEERGRVSNVTALFGVVGAVNIPIIHGSVIWWNSIHQAPSITLKGSSIAPSILWPLALTTLGFTLLFAAIVLMRMRLLIALNKRESRLLRAARA